MADTFLLDTVAEILGPVVSRHASVRDDAGVWVIDGSPLFDQADEIVYVSPDLHPADTRDAARDLLDRLATRGLAIRRDVPITGNGLGTRLARLADQIAATTDPARLDVLAAVLSGLAAEAAERDEAAIPAHCRLDPAALPDGVSSLCARRRA